MILLELKIACKQAFSLLNNLASNEDIQELFYREFYQYNEVGELCF